MEPTGSGIGGDLFAIVWDPKTRRLHGLNASGPSPGGLTFDEFYKGSIADTIDAYARRVDLPLRKSDLAAFKSEWVDPVSVNYRGYDVYELPPNGQGIAALQMLNILEAYDLRAMGSNSSDYLHLQIEAKKLAFEDRAGYYADPRFYEVPLEQLLSKDYAEERRALIRMDKAMRVIQPSPRLERGDTIYLTTADESGMTVSLIQSNYLGMGSGLVPDGLGFVFQDRGALFSMQAQGHVQVLRNIIDFGMNVQEAGDAARYNHRGSSQPTHGNMTDGGTVALESGIVRETREELTRRGHSLVDFPGVYGGYQAILWDSVNRVYRAASEMRKDGMAIGY